MKKYLALVLSMVFVLGFAASAFAIHAEIPAETTPVVAAKNTQIELSGELRIRGWYEDNITNNTGTLKATTGLPYKGGSMSWYDQRVRLAIDVKTAPNVTGRIHLETGEGPRGDVFTWGGTNSIGGEGGQRPLGPTRLLEAWLAYTGSGLLGVPAGIKVGHMPLVVGEGLFVDHRRYGDDAILLYVEPMKGTEINLVTAKLYEGDTDPAAGLQPTDNTDDIDLYSLMLTHKLDKDNTIGLNYSMANSRDINGIISAGTLTETDAYFADAKANLQNVGLFAKGKISDIGYRATADFQFGKIKDISGSDDLKFRGWGVTLGANYKLDPVTLRANFIYGSGDDDDDNKIEQFMTFPATVIDPNIPTVVYNYRVVTAAGAIGTGISNTTAYNLGITASPMKDLTAHLDYYLLRASKKLASTGFGSDKDIGSELDLKLTYRIARNLTYAINAGVLFADDFYKASSTGPTSDPKNAVVFQHQITLSF